MVTPPPEDVDRVAETLWTESRGKIVDRDTFDQAYDDYMGGFQSGRHKSVFKPAVFDKVRQNHDKVSPKRLFTGAKGKNLKQDQRQTAKTVVTSREEYKKRGASKVRVYNLTGRIKGKVVRVRATTIVVRGKSLVRYRDRKGRFASRR